MSARSYLYVPADRPEMLAKAADRGADARDLIGAYQDALEAGAGAAASDGVMFDAAVVRQARRVLERARGAP